MINNIKRIFTCISVFAFCMASNIGLPAKAFVNTNISNIIKNDCSIQQNNNKLVLYSGNDLLQNDIADSNLSEHPYHTSHYSHSSHVSHHSHYSSRY